MDDDIEKELSAALTERARQFSAHQDAWERHRRAVTSRSKTPRRGPRIRAGRERILPWAAATGVIAAAAAGVIVSFHVPGSASNADPQPPVNTVTTTQLAPCPGDFYTSSPSTQARNAGTGLSAAGILTPRPSATAPTTLASPTPKTPRNQRLTVGLSPGTEGAATRDPTSEGASTSALPQDLSWFSTAKSRQLSSAFRAALPAGVAIDASNEPAGLSFGRTGWSAPGSSVLHSTATASAELRAESGVGSLVVTLSRAFAPTPTCLDLSGQAGLRTTYEDGTVVDQAQGVTATHAYLTVLVYRPDGTVARADLLEPLTGKVLTLQQLANAASAPGFDISTPATAADKTAEPLIPTTLTSTSGGGQLPDPSAQPTTH